MSPDENKNRREFNPPLAWDPICGFVYDPFTRSNDTPLLYCVFISFRMIIPGNY